MNTIKDLLHLSTGVTLDDSEYEKAKEAITKMCDITSHLLCRSIYVVDYIRQKFLYVSPHPLFLCGYELEDVKAMGYSFLEKILPPEDFPTFLETFKAHWQFVCNTKPEDRELLRLSYDIYLRHKNGNTILVNKKIAPLFFTKEGYPWIGIAFVDYAAHKHAGYHSVLQNRTQHVTYNRKKGKFVQYTPPKLTPREEQVLRLYTQGYDEKEISVMMGIGVLTVRTHRNNIRKKMNAHSLPQAIGMFYTNLKE